MTAQDQTPHQEAQTQKKKLAINGFGRIGRAAFKIATEMPDLVEVVAINDLTDTKTLAHLLKYDTVYGIYKYEVDYDESHLVVNGVEYPVLSQKDPAQLPWGDMNVDVVLECTGRFAKDGAAKAHIDAGAKKVVLSAPAKGSGDVPTFVIGVNHDQYIGQNLISNASCTTNCISPVVDVVHKNFKVLKSVMTTVHAYTSTQNLVDGPSKDLRRTRAAAQNIIPTSTGAAVAATEAIPELKGKFDGVALRVPVPVGSISDITLLVEKKTTVEEVNKAFIDASQDPFYEGVLGITDEPIVSSDVIGMSESAVVDLEMTRVVDGDLVKVMAWYDNEWGYSNRLVEVALL